MNWPISEQRVGGLHYPMKNGGEGAHTVQLRMVNGAGKVDGQWKIFDPANLCGPPLQAAEAEGMSLGRLLCND